MSVSQSEFVEALLDPTAAVPTGLLDPKGDGAGRRFNVYRNNVAVSLTEALETAFPVLAKLLGEENFKGLAGLYLRQHPPSSPLMMFYGAEMPDFLASMSQLSSLPYLPDVARLELALRKAYHAGDADPIEPEMLQALPPEALMSARLNIHPSARVVESPWPILAIWEFNMVPDAPKPTAGGQSVLVTRPEFDPIQTLISPGAQEFLKSLKNGATFAQAVDDAQTQNPEFDLTTTLASLLSAGAITNIETTP